MGYRSQDHSRRQVEVNERPFESVHERPVVEVTIWSSIDESTTLVFEEVDPARKRLELSGQLLGTVPPEVVSVLRDLGYVLSE